MPKSNMGSHFMLNSVALDGMSDSLCQGNDTIYTAQLKTKKLTNKQRDIHQQQKYRLIKMCHYTGQMLLTLLKTIQTKTVTHNVLKNTNLNELKKKV